MSLKYHMSPPRYLVNIVADEFDAQVAGDRVLLCDQPQRVLRAASGFGFRCVYIYIYIYISGLNPGLWP